MSKYFFINPFEKQPNKDPMAPSYIKPDGTQVIEQEDEFGKKVYEKCPDGALIFRSYRKDGSLLLDFARNLNFEIGHQYDEFGNAVYKYDSVYDENNVLALKNEYDIDYYDDGKKKLEVLTAYPSNVTTYMQYDEAGKPCRIDAVVCSTQHDPDVTQEQIHEDIKKYVFDAIIPADMVDADTKYFINPTGRFVIGGPHGDSGLTGRKIIVDTYGGAGRHGGGAFSGKDCTKVDRSAAYAARYVAKNIVAAGLADKCEIQLSYAIGVAKPTSINVNTFGTGKLSDTKLVDIIRDNFDLRPAGIIRMLDLRRPIYKQTAAYGHFGRTDVDLPWEKLDKVDDLKKYL